MKQIWKRSMSLLLSGVLLLSNVPLSALATEESPAPTETVVEEVQPVETELVQTQSVEIQPIENQSVETQPVVTVLEHTAEVANTGLESKLQIIQNDNPVDDAWLGTNYDEEQNQLTLNAENLDSVFCKEASQSLKIVLEEGTTSTISGALIAQMGIQITGKGTLIVGSIDAGENLEIVDAVVKVGSDKQSEEETKNLIKVKNEIKVSGEAHLATANGHNAVVFSENDPEKIQNNGITGIGYSRKAKDGTFTPVGETDKIIPESGSYFEFVSGDHLKGVYKDADNHKLTCKENKNTKCKLEVPEVSVVAHTESRKAGCGLAAHCDACGSDYGDIVTAHLEDETWETTPVNHKKWHACCRQVLLEGEHVFSHTCTAGSAVIMKTCTDCQFSDKAFEVQKPENLTWNNSEKVVSVTPEDCGYLYDVDYFRILEGENETPTPGEPESVDKCIEPGNYRAVVTVTIEGQTFYPEVKFTIAPVKLTADMVTLSKESVEFSGLNSGATPPEVTVGSELEKDKDYKVSYYRGAEVTTDFASVGDITVKVTGINHYSETVEKPFTITKAKPTADMFDFAEPSALTYDGEVKNAAVTPKSGIAGMGNVTLKYYKNNTLVEGSVIDAGEYTVKISVADGTNYAATTEDLTYTDWEFTIAPADVTPPEALNTVYTDITEDRQLIAAGLNRFEGPRITGYTRTGADAPDQITGTVTYTYDDNTTEDIDAVNRYLNGLPDDTTVTVAYELVPNVPNYTGKTKKQEVSLTRTTLVVKLNNVAASKDEILQAIKAQAPKYGDKIVDTSKLSVHKGDAAEAIPGTFTVKYSKSENGVYGEQLELEKPGAGSYKFYVYFNSTSRSVGAISDLLVAEGDVIIGKKTPSVTVKPNAERKFVYNGQDQNLEVVTTDGGTLKYRIHGQTEWKNTLTLKDAAVYWVYYKVVGDNNHNSLPESVERKITVTILPKLESTFGNKLNSVALPAGWTWHVDSETLADVLVGSAGEYEEYQYTLDYNADKDSATNPTGSQVSVPMKILRKEVKIQVTLPETHYKLVKKSATVIGLEKTITPVVKYYKTATELEALPSAEYNVSRSLTDYPGHGEVTVTSKNVNYDFSEDSDLSESYIVYRPGAYSLSIVPDTLKSTYDDVSELKEALHNGLEKKHADADVTYYNVKMQEYDETVATNWRASDEELYCPENGFTFTLPYPTGEDENTEFELVGINTMNNASNRSVAKISFALKSGGIEFQMKNYAAVCLAWDGYNETDTYKVDTATSSYGTVKFTVGSDTTKKTSDDAVKVEEKINVFAEPNTNYAVTKVQYTYKDGSTTKAATIKQDDSGNYTFKMPAKDITIKVTFSKKTTSTKNPYSGDTSNIYLWLAILASSAVGIVALVIFWFKKRRK